MGWTNSPAYFCVATQTVQELVRRLLALTVIVGIPEPHRHDGHCAVDGADARGDAPWHKPEDLTLLSCVFMDDFCNGLGGPPQWPHKRQEQQWVVQANLHRIHGIFPSPEVIHHAGGKDSISMKKLAKGDTHWKPEEELLGVLFHGWAGKDQMFSLPPSKYQKYQDTLTGALDAPRGIIGFDQFWKLHGQIQYITSVIPCMKFLITPLNRRLTWQGEAVGLGKDNPLWRTLLRLRHLLDIAQAQPTHDILANCCSQLASLPGHSQRHGGESGRSVVTMPPGYSTHNVAVQMAGWHRGCGKARNAQHGGLQVGHLFHARVHAGPPA
jgi:hypothetical protein